MNRQIFWKAGSCLLAVWVCLGWSWIARAECDVPVVSSPGASESVVLSKHLSQEKLNQLKIMNYYPADYSWENMWTQWEPAVIDKDFALIASMHANTVRIIVNTQAFGYPQPASEMLAELSEAIEMACSHGLQVQLTLFDWFPTPTSSYSDISGSEAWADAVVGPYRNDPRIAFIELQNEIKPEDAAAMKWAQKMVPHLQEEVGDIPVTLSVTSGTSGSPCVELSTLIQALGSVKLDFLDIHQYYGAPFDDYYELSQAQQIAKQQVLALLVGETGASTNVVDYKSTIAIPLTLESYEAWQSYAYRSAFYASSKLGLPTPAPWILWDFKPKSVTWVKPNSDEYNYGLYLYDGTPKIAAVDVSKFFADGTVDTSFNNGFEDYIQIKDSSALPTLWQINGANLGNFAIDTEVAHTGHASVKIWNSSSSATVNPSFYITPVIPVEHGLDYMASVYVKGKDATGTTDICLSWFDSSFGWLGQQCGGSLEKTTGWKQISVTETAPEKTAYVQLFLNSANNTGTAWFDDVSFQQKIPQKK